jgi:hypothetical protein
MVIHDRDILESAKNPIKSQKVITNTLFSPAIVTPTIQPKQMKSNE